jgi:hypothetical protein
MRFLPALAVFCSLAGSIQLAGAVEIPGSDASRRAKDEAARRSTALGIQGGPLLGGSSATMSGYTSVSPSTGGASSSGVPSRKPAAPRLQHQQSSTAPSNNGFPF